MSEIGPVTKPVLRNSLFMWITKSNTRIAIVAAVVGVVIVALSVLSAVPLVIIDDRKESFLKSNSLQDTLTLQSALTALLSSLLSMSTFFLSDNDPSHYTQVLDLIAGSSPNVTISLWDVKNVSSYKSVADMPTVLTHVFSYSTDPSRSPGFNGTNSTYLEPSLDKILSTGNPSLRLTLVDYPSFIYTLPFSLSMKFPSNYTNSTSDAFSYVPFPFLSARGRMLLSPSDEHEFELTKVITYVQPLGPLLSASLQRSTSNHIMAMFLSHPLPFEDGESVPWLVAASLERNYSKTLCLFLTNFGRRGGTKDLYNWHPAIVTYSHISKFFDSSNFGQSVIFLYFKTVFGPTLVMTVADRDLSDETTIYAILGFTLGPSTGILFGILIATLLFSWRSLSVNGFSLSSALSAEKRLSAEAVEATRTRILTYASHQMRNPLHAIMGLLSLLKSSETLTQEGSENVLAMELAAGGLLQVLNDISRISAVDTPITAVPKAMNIRTLVTHLVAQLHGTTSATVIVETAPEVPVEIYTDPLRLAQLLSIALNNATRFSRPEVPVLLSIGLGALPQSAVGPAPAFIEEGSSQPQPQPQPLSLPHCQPHEIATLVVSVMNLSHGLPPGGTVEYSGLQGDRSMGSMLPSFSNYNSHIYSHHGASLEGSSRFSTTMGQQLGSMLSHSRLQSQAPTNANNTNNPHGSRTTTGNLLGATFSSFSNLHGGSRRSLMRTLSHAGLSIAGGGSGGKGKRTSLPSSLSFRNVNPTPSNTPGTSDKEKEHEMDSAPPQPTSSGQQSPHSTSTGNLASSEMRALSLPLILRRNLSLRHLHSNHSVGASTVHTPTNSSALVRGSSHSYNSAAPAGSVHGSLMDFSILPSLAGYASSSVSFAPPAGAPLPIVSMINQPSSGNNTAHGSSVMLGTIADTTAVTDTIGSASSVVTMSAGSTPFALPSADSSPFAVSLPETASGSPVGLRSPVATSQSTYSLAMPVRTQTLAQNIGVCSPTATQLAAAQSPALTVVSSNASMVFPPMQQSPPLAAPITPVVDEGSSSVTLQTAPLEDMSTSEMDETLLVSNSVTSTAIASAASSSASTVAPPKRLSDAVKSSSSLTGPSPVLRLVIPSESSKQLMASLHAEPKVVQRTSASLVQGGDSSASETRAPSASGSEHRFHTLRQRSVSGSSHSHSSSSTSIHSRGTSFDPVTEYVVVNATTPGSEARTHRLTPLLPLAHARSRSLSHSRPHGSSQLANNYTNTVYSSNSSANSVTNPNVAIPIHPLSNSTTSSQTVHPLALMQPPVHSHAMAFQDSVLFSERDSGDRKGLNVHSLTLNPGLMDSEHGIDKKEGKEKEKGKDKEKKDRRAMEKEAKKDKKDKSKRKDRDRDRDRGLSATPLTLNLSPGIHPSTIVLNPNMPAIPSNLLVMNRGFSPSKSVSQSTPSLSSSAPQQNMGSLNMNVGLYLNRNPSMGHGLTSSFQNGGDMGPSTPAMHTMHSLSLTSQVPHLVVDYPLSSQTGSVVGNGSNLSMGNLNVQNSTSSEVLRNRYPGISQAQISAIQQSCGCLTALQLRVPHITAYNTVTTANGVTFGREGVIMSENNGSLALGPSFLHLQDNNPSSTPTNVNASASSSPQKPFLDAEDSQHGIYGFPHLLSPTPVSNSASSNLANSASGYLESPAIPEPSTSLFARLLRLLRCECRRYRRTHPLLVSVSSSNPSPQASSSAASTAAPLPSLIVAPFPHLSQQSQFMQTPGTPMMMSSMGSVNSSVARSHIRTIADHAQSIGLGLLLARRIADALQATLEVYDENPVICGLPLPLVQCALPKEVLTVFRCEIPLRRKPTRRGSRRPDALQALQRTGSVQAPSTPTATLTPSGSNPHALLNAPSVSVPGHQQPLQMQVQQLPGTTASAGSGAAAPHRVIVGSQDGVIQIAPSRSAVTSLNLNLGNLGSESMSFSPPPTDPFLEGFSRLRGSTLDRVEGGSGIVPGRGSSLILGGPASTPTTMRLLRSFVTGEDSIVAGTAPPGVVFPPTPSAASVSSTPLATTSISSSALGAGGSSIIGRNVSTQNLQSRVEQPSTATPSSPLGTASTSSRLSSSTSNPNLTINAPSGTSLSTQNQSVLVASSGASPAPQDSIAGTLPLPLVANDRSTVGTRTDVGGLFGVSVDNKLPLQAHSTSMSPLSTMKANSLTIVRPLLPQSPLTMSAVSSPAPISDSTGIGPLAAASAAAAAAAASGSVAAAIVAAPQQSFYSSQLLNPSQPRATDTGNIAITPATFHSFSFATSSTPVAGESTANNPPDVSTPTNSNSNNASSSSNNSTVGMGPALMPQHSLVKKLSSVSTTAESSRSTSAMSVSSTGSLVAGAEVLRLAFDEAAKRREASSESRDTSKEIVKDGKDVESSDAPDDMPPSRSKFLSDADLPQVKEIALPISAVRSVASNLSLAASQSRPLSLNVLKPTADANEALVQSEEPFGSLNTATSTSISTRTNPTVNLSANNLSMSLHPLPVSGLLDPSSPLPTSRSPVSFSKLVQSLGDSGASQGSFSPLGLSTLLPSAVHGLGVSHSSSGSNLMNLGLGNSPATPISPLYKQLNVNPSTTPNQGNSLISGNSALTINLAGVNGISTSFGFGSPTVNGLTLLSPTPTAALSSPSALLPISSLRVLYADDENINRRIMKSIIGKLGCVIVPVADGLDVVKMLEQSAQLPPSALAEAEALAQPGPGFSMSGSRTFRSLGGQSMGFDDVLGSRAATDADSGLLIEEEVVQIPPFDLILLDIVMTRLHGDVLCTFLRSKGISVPIIAVTGNAHGSEHLLSCGFDVVIGKPFQQSLIADILEKVKTRSSLQNLHIPDDSIETPYSVRLNTVKTAQYSRQTTTSSVINDN